MPSFTHFRIAGIICAIMTSSLAAFPTPVGTAFSYQGVIKSGGVPLSGAADFQFTLFDAASGPNQIGSTVAVNNVSVSNGVMNATLDFGALAFDGNDRWLEIAVRSPAGGGAFTTLAPRQKLVAVPYAQQTRGMFVDASNRIGIGTTTPSAPLHIASDLFPVLNLQDTGSPTTQVGYVSFRDGANTETAWVGYGTAGSPHFSMVNARSGGDIDLQCFGAAGSIRLYPGTSGEVQIGAGPNDYQRLRLGGGNSSGFLYGSFPALGDGIHIGYNFFYDAAGTPHIIDSVGGTSRITMGYNSIDLAVNTPGFSHFPVTVLHVQSETSGSSSVGIASAVLPQFTLHVGGTAGKPGGGSWSNSSDIRLKKNIEPLQGSLDRLLALHGVTFEYIDPKAIDELEGRRIGMIAQEVEKVFPDWVGERRDGYKSVTYRGFEALTVEALRDLREEKDAQIAMLQHDNQQLQDRLAAVEAALARMTNQKENH